MRVSLPICIASSLAVVLLAWWLSTRSKDFLTAPSEAELEQIRMAASQTNPTAQGMGDALSPSNPDQQQAPIPVVLPEHVASAPKIDDYLDEANHGADYLVELAEQLDRDGHPLRALTCWERVIDSTKATDDQKQRAVRHIRQLKAKLGPREADPNGGIKIIIQAGTGPTTAEHLKPALDDFAEQLERYSSGTLLVEAKVSIGEEDLVDEGEAPIAIWISGPTEESRSTDIGSFSHPTDSPDGLSEKLSHEIYRLTRHYLNQMDDFRPLPKLSEQDSPDKLLEDHMTRMVWMKFAESLQTKP